jgi:hypothetical protein
MVKALTAGDCGASFLHGLGAGLHVAQAVREIGADLIGAIDNDFALDLFSHSGESRLIGLKGRGRKHYLRRLHRFFDALGICILGCQQHLVTERLQMIRQRCADLTVANKCEFHAHYSFSL